MLLKITAIFLFFNLLVPCKSSAQTTCSTLGQNPETAFPVCGTSVFKQSLVPLCGGRRIPSPCPDLDSVITDVNPFWYKFTCFESGKLELMIIPDSLFEDYDWQIFDVTGKDPRDVYTDTSMFVACNWSADPGITGASDVSGGVSLVECEGFGVNRFSKMPDLIAGHNYLLLISHFEITLSGYSLSFGGTGNTAVITDTIPPHMSAAEPVTCDGSEIIVKLNKRMKCNSLALDGSDFVLSPPVATISAISGIGCAAAFDMDSIFVTFSAPLPVGNYQITARNGSDGNTILDLCNNGIPVGESIPFTVLSPLPVPMDSLQNNRCSTDSVLLVFPDALKCNSVAADGSDFFVTGTYPVTISNAMPVNCVNGLTKLIVVRFTSTLIQPGNFQIVLQTGSDGNTLLSECDTPSVAGSAIPFSIKPKPVAAFSFPGSACLPNADISFTNLSTISDGSQNSFQYAWNFGNPGSGRLNTSDVKNPTHVYNNTGPYTVTLQVTSNAGCIHDSTILLNTIHPQPVADFGFSKPAVCIGTSVILLDSSDGMDGITEQWLWTLGDANTASTQNVTHTYANDGTYTISLYTINSHGCKSDVRNKNFTVYPYPTVSAGPDRVVLEGGNVSLQASATGTALQYLWTPSLYLSDVNILNPVSVKPEFDIFYTLTVTAAGGCSVTDEVFVDVLKIPKIPNTFSPNNDGINDFWEIQYLDEYKTNHTQVFTRAGQLVFESRGLYKPWNGTFKGKPLPVDTYYYIIEPGSGREPFTGYVTILK